MESKAPNTPTVWMAQANAHGVQDLSIHDHGSRFSGSNITVPHFLLLRVIWPKERMPEVLYHQDRRRWIERSYLDQSRSFLACPQMNAAWSGYLQSITKTSQRLRDECFSGLQTFSLVRYHQIQSLDPDFESDAEIAKLNFSPPVSSRTRARAALPPRPTTPTPSVNITSIGNQFATMFLEDSPSTSVGTPSFSGSLDTHATPSDVFSPFTGSIEDQFKAIQDEQIVNTALILFLNALTIHSALRADWTLHRRAFISRNRNGEKTYEARVDGLLRRRQDDKPLAILEVKPFTRRKKRLEIMMQESAQMAAWISQHPPRELEDMRANSKKSYRLIISQDRHEIFLTFAEFDAAYCDYIRHKNQTVDVESYLVMNEYGPFNTGSRTEIKYLGELVLAFSLQACAEM
ncbi:hypothetical protein GGR51DRAFT_537491 [Nemania sp. FL0031]|nr:hypothetical protein GGR51DRAFT_537491 [Nemania sp. FL0031]